MSAVTNGGVITETDGILSLVPGNELLLVIGALQAFKHEWVAKETVQIAIGEKLTDRLIGKRLFETRRSPDTSASQVRLSNSLLQYLEITRLLRQEIRVSRE